MLVNKRFCEINLIYKTKTKLILYRNIKSIFCYTTCLLLFVFFFFKGYKRALFFWPILNNGTLNSEAVLNTSSGVTPGQQRRSSTRSWWRVCRFRTVYANVTLHLSSNQRSTQLRAAHPNPYPLFARVNATLLKSVMSLLSDDLFLFFF